MAIPDDHTMIMVTIYKGRIPRPGKLVEWGWCALPKHYGPMQLEDVLRIKKHFNTHGYPADKYIVMCYPIDRTRGFRVSDRILGVFG